MARKPRTNSDRRMSTGEFLGHIWGGIFVAIVVILTAVLVGKGCFGG